MQVFNGVPSFVIQRLNRHEPLAYFASRCIVQKVTESLFQTVSNTVAGKTVQHH